MLKNNSAHTTPKPAPNDLRRMPADQLISGLKQLVKQDNQLTADLLAYLAEVDHRKLYLEAAFPSMFAARISRVFDEGSKA